MNGQAEGLVTVTGARTRLSEIAALTGKVEAPPSPLALELRRIVRATAAVALGIGVLFFVLSLLVGISWRDAFLFAIGVAVGAGWSPGAELPASEVLMAASGAAFTTVVLGQLANAFACRSASTPPWRLGWVTNRLLVWAVLAEVGLLLVFLFVGPVATLLGHTPPSPGGLAVALAAVPAVILADWLYKEVRHRRSGASAPAAPAARFSAPLSAPPAVQRQVRSKASDPRASGQRGSIHKGPSSGSSHD